MLLTPFLFLFHFMHTLICSIPVNFHGKLYAKPFHA